MTYIYNFLWCFPVWCFRSSWIFIFFIFFSENCDGYQKRCFSIWLVREQLKIGFIFLWKDQFFLHIHTYIPLRNAPKHECSGPLAKPYLNQRPFKVKEHYKIVHEGFRLACPHCDYENGRMDKLKDHIKAKHSIDRKGLNLGHHWFLSLSDICLSLCISVYLCLSVSPFFLLFPSLGGVDGSNFSEFV